MQIKQLIKEKEEQLKQQSYIEFSDEQISSLSKDDKKKIIDTFHGRSMLKLPASEIAFFEWLKKEDNAVWQDLWADFPEWEYRVSIDFLDHLGDAGNGFPICDLEDVENYYFTIRHIKPGGRGEMQAIVDKNDAGEKLNIDELLLFELHLAPIDIWHYAYRYKLALTDAKKMIEDMVYKGWLVHLPNRDDLTKYIEF